MPADLPEYLAVDLSGLEDGGVVMMTDIELPEGVELTALAGDDEESDAIMIANTVHVKESQGTGAAAAEEAELEAAAEAGEDATDETGEADEAEAGSEESAGDDSESDES